ncbi:MAG: PD-(D/E)XK nuclease family protein [Saprospiraceae bacterium]|uniref:PD-(D/E)XK nuclease family protein n=1 Tax=Candidatus Opimibacter skivensis TaxID=2982028 RepID=A0A9D7SXA1_9BACT|nr:PD-(D/E)XK nuclease family protein [Candidatus Opimibacter skivensis]
MIRLKKETSQEILDDLNSIVNGTIELDDKFSNLSKLFYKIIKSAAATEPIAFRNFYAQYRFVTTQVNMDSGNKANLDAFRRLIKKPAGNLIITEILCNQGSLLLFALIKELIGEEEQSFFVNISATYIPDYFCSFFPNRNYSTLKDIKILCSSWSNIISTGNDAYFILNGYDLDNMEGSVEILMQNHEHSDYTYLHTLLSENVILNCKQLKFEGNESSIYQTTFDSLFVIEPDYLVDATAIGECFQSNGANSDLFILKKIIEEIASGSAAIKGSIVGYYFDEMLIEDDIGTETLFFKAQREYALKAAQFGQIEMNKIKDSIEAEHFPKIQTLANNERTRKCWIEPTFFSIDYGIQGRIDLLSGNEEVFVQNILELKSGSSPNPNMNIAWPGHHMQVVCYDMALESTYGANRNGTNSIFYSGCNIMPRRNIVSEHREKQRVLKIRNYIVTKVFRLAENDFTILEKIKINGINPLPPFHANALKEFRQYYIPTSIETYYYNEMVAFTLRELINSKVGNMLRGAN